jgi:hypothetical protein
MIVKMGILPPARVWFYGYACVSIKGTRAMRAFSLFALVLGALSAWTCCAVAASAALRSAVQEMQRIEQTVAAAIAARDVRELGRQYLASSKLPQRLSAADAPTDCQMAASHLTGIIVSLETTAPTAQTTLALDRGARQWVRDMTACEAQVGLAGKRYLYP